MGGHRGEKHGDLAVVFQLLRPVGVDEVRKAYATVPEPEEFGGLYVYPMDDRPVPRVACPKADILHEVLGRLGGRHEDECVAIG